MFFLAFLLPATLDNHMVELISKNHNLTVETRKIPVLEKQLHEVTVRLAAAVEVITERELAIQEMIQDLVDVKEMYNKQIQDLLMQLQERSRQ